MQQRPTVVHLMRHGQVHNPEGVLYGRLPGFGLSELGHEMAARLAEYWDGIPLTHLRCSPLQRARETLAPTAELFPQLDVVIDERVTEAANAFEGKVFGADNKALRDVRMIRHVLNPLRPAGVSPTGRSWRGCGPRWVTPPPRPARAGRRWWSAISCPSKWPAVTPRAGCWPTIRVAAAAPWFPLPPSPSVAVS